MITSETMSRVFTEGKYRFNNAAITALLAYLRRSELPFRLTGASAAHEFCRVASQNYMLTMESGYDFASTMAIFDDFLKSREFKAFKGRKNDNSDWRFVVDAVFDSYDKPTKLGGNNYIARCEGYLCERDNLDDSFHFTFNITFHIANLAGYAGTTNHEILTLFADIAKEAAEQVVEYAGAHDIDNMLCALESVITLIDRFAHTMTNEDIVAVLNKTNYAKRLVDFPDLLPAMLSDTILSCTLVDIMRSEDITTPKALAERAVDVLKDRLEYIKGIHGCYNGCNFDYTLTEQDIKTIHNARDYLFENIERYI